LTLPSENPLSAPSTMEKSLTRKNLTIRTQVILLISFLAFLCSAACMATFGFTLFTVRSEQTQAQDVLNTYIQKLSENKINEAYFMLSPDMKSLKTLEEFRSMVEQDNDLQFQGYQNMTFRNFRIVRLTNRQVQNHEFLAGFSVWISATVNYEGGKKNDLDAILEKRNGQWSIFEMKLYSSPDSRNPISSLILV